MLALKYDPSNQQYVNGLKETEEKIEYMRLEAKKREEEALAREQEREAAEEQELARQKVPSLHCFLCVLEQLYLIIYNRRNEKSRKLLQQREQLQSVCSRLKSAPFCPEAIFCLGRWAQAYLLLLLFLLSACIKSGNIKRVRCYFFLSSAFLGTAVVYNNGKWGKKLLYVDILFSTQP